MSFPCVGIEVCGQHTMLLPLFFKYHTAPCCFDVNGHHRECDFHCLTAVTGNGPSVNGVFKVIFFFSGFFVLIVPI